MVEEVGAIRINVSLAVAVFRVLLFLVFAFFFLSFGSALEMTYWFGPLFTQALRFN